MKYCTFATQFWNKIKKKNGKIEIIINENFNLQTNIVTSIKIKFYNISS